MSRARQSLLPALKVRPPLFRVLPPQADGHLPQSPGDEEAGYRKTSRAFPGPSPGAESSVQGGSGSGLGEKVPAGAWALALGRELQARWPPPGKGNAYSWNKFMAQQGCPTKSPLKLREALTNWWPADLSPLSGRAISQCRQASVRGAEPSSHPQTTGCLNRQFVSGSCFWPTPLVASMQCLRRRMGYKSAFLKATHLLGLLPCGATGGKFHSGPSEGTDGEQSG